MKVAHLVLGGDVAGGQAVALQLARAARARGHEVLFVSPTPGPFVETARTEGFDVHLLPIRSSLDVRAALRLRRLLREERVELLHTHVMIEANVVSRVAGRLAGTHVLSHMHIEGYPRGRIVVVHNGVELPADAPNGAGDGIVEVARLAPVKGQRELIEAVARLDGVRVTLVGRDLERGGDYERELRALADGLGVADRVDFAGYRADAAELMGGAALVVLPSWTEGLPMTLLEAMARRRPVVATPVGGTPEVVADGETGVLVPARDPAALADAIAALLRDPARRRRLGDAGRARVAAQFTLERTAGRILDLYDEAARG